MKASGRPEAPALRPLGERLVSGASWAFLGRMLALPVGLLSTMLLARLLSPADLGAYFLAFSLANLLAILAQLGLGRPMVKLIAAGWSGPTAPPACYP